MKRIIKEGNEYILQKELDISGNYYPNGRRYTEKGVLMYISNHAIALSKSNDPIKESDRIRIHESASGLVKALSNGEYSVEGHKSHINKRTFVSKEKLSNLDKILILEPTIKSN